MLKKKQNVVPFRRKKTLSLRVVNLLNSMPAYKAKLENFVKNLSEEDKIETIELIKPDHARKRTGRLLDGIPACNSWTYGSACF